MNRGDYHADVSLAIRSDTPVGPPLRLACEVVIVDRPYNKHDRQQRHLISPIPFDAYRVSAGTPEPPEDDFDIFPPPSPCPRPRFPTSHPPNRIPAPVAPKGRPRFDLLAGVEKRQKLVWGDKARGGLKWWQV